MNSFFFSFFLLQQSIDAYTFLVFMVFCLVTTVFVFFFVPETKGKTFEEVVKGFRGEKNRQQGYEMNEKEKI